MAALHAPIVIKVTLCCEVLAHFHTVRMSSSDFHIFGLLHMSAIVQATEWFFYHGEGIMHLMAEFHVCISVYGDWLSQKHIQ